MRDFGYCELIEAHQMSLRQNGTAVQSPFLNDLGTRKPVLLGSIL